MQSHRGKSGGDAARRWTYVLVGGAALLLAVGLGWYVVHSANPSSSDSPPHQSEAGPTVAEPDGGDPEILGPGGRLAPDPHDIDLPPIQEATETREFLQGEGRDLLRFHERTAWVSEIELDEEAPRICTSRVENEILPLAERPEDLYAVAAASPSDEIGHLLANEIAAKRDFFTACADAGQDAPKFQQESAFTHVLVHRRLVELRVISEGD